MPTVLKRILVVVIFVICVALVIIGKNFVGIPGLLVMLLGLGGLLALLGYYNSFYTDKKKKKRD